MDRRQSVSARFVLTISSPFTVEDEFAIEGWKSYSFRRHTDGRKGDRMSLPNFNSQIELLGLQLQRDKLFKAQDRYRLFAEKVYPVLMQARERLEACYCADNGRPAKEPVLVLGVSLLQFMERLPDRQAVEHLKYHVGWKYALGQELDGELFDSTVLVRFRQRLLEHGQERVIFEEVLGALEEAGLVAKRGSAQRLDSTHVLGLVKRMSSLDRAREVLRMALKAMAEEKLKRRPVFWQTLWERYVESTVDFRSTPDVIQKKLVQVGQDMQVLLAWIDGQKMKRGPKSDSSIRLLRTMFAENFVVEVGTKEPVVVRGQTGESRIQNPYDPEASYRAKGEKKWVGYAVQVAEALPVGKDGEPEKGTGFLTSIVSHTARGSDEAGMQKTFDEQRAMGFDKPKVLFVDTAYVSAAELATAKQEKRELVGPVMPSHAPKGGYSVEEFRVDIASRRATCPAGERSTQCSRIEDRFNKMIEYRFEWSWKCGACSLRRACLGSKQEHRTIRVRDNFMYLQARRDEMKTDAFKEKMKRRAGIEGTISELVRGYGLRQARYRGLAKMQLQSYFIGAACNIRRWIRKLTLDSVIFVRYGLTAFGELLMFQCTHHAA
jgi:transposase